MDPYDEKTGWSHLVGSTVEIRRGDVVRIGTVEAATQDGSILWIAADGPDSRFLIHRDDGVVVLPTSS